MATSIVIKAETRAIYGEVGEVASIESVRYRGVGGVEIEGRMMPLGSSTGRDGR
jgi:hypothetical protein